LHRCGIRNAILRTSTGTVTLKREPFPTTERSSIPWSSNLATRSTIAKPNPGHCVGPALDVELAEFLKDLVMLIRGYSPTRIQHFDADHAGALTTADHNSARSV